MLMAWATTTDEMYRWALRQDMVWPRVRAQTDFSANRVRELNEYFIIRLLFEGTIAAADAASTEWADNLMYFPDRGFITAVDMTSWLGDTGTGHVVTNHFHLTLQLSGAIPLFRAHGVMDTAGAANTYGQGIGQTHVSGLYIPFNDDDCVQLAFFKEENTAGFTLLGGGEALIHCIKED